MTVPRVLVVADDLSGAADCGIAFAASGLSTVVMLSDAPAAVAADVLAVDANSRRLPPEEAAAVNARLVQRHLAGRKLLCKKINSTLRGNVGAEVAAVIPLAGLAIVAPAFPDTGRTTRGGRVYVNGVPLEATEIWQREKLVGVADIAAILARAGVRPARAALDLVRGDTAHLRRTLDRVAAEGATAVVCDAETEQDLAAIAEASARLTRKVFWVGSAGLARHLPAAAGLVAAPLPPIAAHPHGPVLVVVGSLSAVSRAQAGRLAAEPGVTTLTVTPEALRHGPGHRAWQAAGAALAAALDRGADVLLTIGVGETVDLAEGWRLCTALGRLVVPSASRLGSLVCTGGDTARALLSALGAVGLRLVREIEPGVVLSTVEGGRPLPVVTKAGAFGGPETLIRCRAALRAAHAARSGE